jgi:thiosulfate/3-mercaptopyruvate sulfurtransferase
MQHKTFVSGATLEAHLGHWVVVDCRFDLTNKNWGFDQYLVSHVPTATYASLARDLSGPATGTNGRHPLPAIDRLAATLGRLGIDQSAQVVLYDQDAGAYASRLWWMLRYVGHESAAVLDGGWARWVAEGRPVRIGEEQRQPVTFVPSLRPAMLATVEEVAEMSRSGNRLLVDARAPERYEGRTETVDRVAGHIPGAVNHFYKENVTSDGTIRPPQELRTSFEETLGSHTARDIVMYCGSGVTACQNLLAMEHAGMPGARLYVGSWSEWSSNPTRPVATGAGKRGRA